MSGTPAAMMLLALLLPLPAVAADDTSPSGEGVAVPAWVADAAVYRVQVDAEGKASLTLTYTFRPLRRDWVDLRLVGPELAVSRTDGPVLPSADGLHLLLGILDTPVSVQVAGAPRVSTPGGARISVLPAARQEVDIDAPGWDVEVVGAVGGALSGSATLDLRWAPHHESEPAPVTALVTAESSTAVWGEEGVLQVRSRVQWRVVRGETAAFSLDVSGLDEVDVQGANVARWVRSGDVVAIEARAPVRGGFAVDVSARAALPAGASVPGPSPQGVTRVNRYWTVARSEEGELLPESAPRSVSLRALPSWARGLSEAAPLAAWRGDAPLVLRAARYEPMMGPDTVIESAEFVLANSIEGRELLRSVWLVRNERRQYLHVRPAAGWRPLTARVSGDPVSVLSDGADGLYVPLEKSVETVRGLMSFPVEVTWMASHEAWARRGSRRFELPAVDAPIQTATWSVHLPRTVAAARAAVVSPASGYDPQKEEARESWLAAMSAYKDNRFEEAQGWLDHAKSLDESDENVARLQSNLDVLLDFRGKDNDGDGLRDEVDDAGIVLGGIAPSGGADGDDFEWNGPGGDASEPDDRSYDAEAKPEDVMVRRVRELANAKTAGQQVAQAEAEEQARKALLAGDEEAASNYLETVVELSRQIGVTVQKEDRGQSDKLSEAMKNLEGVKVRKAEKQKAEKAGETVATATTTSGSYHVDGLMMKDVTTSHGGEVATSDREVATGSGEVAPAADERVAVPEPAIVDSEPSSESVVVEELTVESLARIPTVRSFQAAVSTVPGVAMGGRTRNRDDSKGGGIRGEGLPDTSRATGGKKAASAAVVVTPPPGNAPPPPPAKPAAAPAPEAVAPIQAPAAPASGPAPRRALAVKASPLTPALPLDGATVQHTDALLAADTNPTFTVRYRTRKEK